MKSIAIIPARTGSKRLAGKNLRMINGKTLIDYAIQASLESQVFSDIIITSNDQKTLELMQDNYGEKIQYHLRPPSLSTDTCQLKTLVGYLIELHEAEFKDFDSTIALILPTSPLRTHEDIRACSALMVKHLKDINGVMSVARLRHPPQHSLKIDEDGYIQTMYQGQIEIQSQKLEPAYIHDGSIIFVKSKSFMKYGDFYMPNMMPYYISENRAVDINTAFDLKLAEFLMQK
jgi:CMP-N,N'-diacetyllegionaminic acid synthase